METTEHHHAIQNLQALERYIERYIQQTGKAVGEPFVFLLKPEKANVTYHVIDWKTSASHSKENHKQFARTGELENQKVTILGFYSDHHQGIFTHHDAKIHLHVITENQDLVGHVDQLEWSGEFMLSFAD